jgi:hypothetical protein
MVVCAEQHALRCSVREGDTSLYVDIFIKKTKKYVRKLNEDKKIPEAEV